MYQVRKEPLNLPLPTHLGSSLWNKEAECSSADTRAPTSQLDSSGAGMALRTIQEKGVRPLESVLMHPQLRSNSLPTVLCPACPHSTLHPQFEERAGAETVPPPDEIVLISGFLHVWNTVGHQIFNYLHHGTYIPGLYSWS